jgi:cytochrome P450
VTIVTELDLPVLDYTPAELAGDGFHERLAELSRQARGGWLARSPLSFIVVDRESAEFFLRSRAAAFPGRELAEMFGVTSGQLREQIDANILNQQGGRHRRLRSLVGHAFSQGAADLMRPQMRGFLAQLWAGIPGPRCDAVTALARPYPSLTIAAVLGAPLDDAPLLHEWSTWVQRQFDITALASQLPEMERAVAEVYSYVQALLARRGGEPADDLVTALLTAAQDGDRLSGDECINLVLNVIAGGIDTTQAQLAHALALFAAHPLQWELLARRPGLIPAAVQEVLRAEPITPFTARICLERLEHRGVIFPAGTIVAICAERANRELDGEEFDITARRDARLLTFGAGAHFCLGANLARAELQEALAFLAPRMPGLAADGPAVLGGVEGIYGIKELPLRWSAA